MVAGLMRRAENFYLGVAAAASAGETVLETCFTAFTVAIG
jgi:hypothetical protein